MALPFSAICSPPPSDNIESDGALNVKFSGIFRCGATTSTIEPKMGTAILHSLNLLHCKNIQHSTFNFQCPIACGFGNP
jgi:hypothetical protein